MRKAKVGALYETIKNNAISAWSKVHPNLAPLLPSAYINGHWVPIKSDERTPVVNPSCKEIVDNIALAGDQELNQAVASAKEAQKSFGLTSKEERLALLKKILTEYQESSEAIATALSIELGVPHKMARNAQVAAGTGHLKATIQALQELPLENPLANGQHKVAREPIGVCGLITPWNWPLNQITCKVAPALAAGCSVVLKPSELTPLSALLFADVMHRAGVPAGVFNMLNGTGPTIGAGLAKHPDVDMVSFTGSTRAGVKVAKLAAPTVKRVTQELGGKSPNIVLEDHPEFDKQIEQSVRWMMSNSGQSCNAPSRLLVPEKLNARALEVAKSVAEKLIPGDPFDERTDLGPVVSKRQFDKIQKLIASGEKEATLVCGGQGIAKDLEPGFFVKPTVFGNCKNSMTICREEIFGPVLTVIPYRSIDEAIDIANDTPYGLAAYVSGQDQDTLRKVARQLKAGMIHINGKYFETSTPFGGYKMSGNGREWGKYGIDEYLEYKSWLGGGKL